MNGAATFPSSVSISGPALFCTGNAVQSASLVPGFDLSLNGMNLWPQSAADAKKVAFQELLTFHSGLTLVQQRHCFRQECHHRMDRRGRSLA